MISPELGGKIIRGETKRVTTLKGNEYDGHITALRSILRRNFGDKVRSSVFIRGETERFVFNFDDIPPERLPDVVTTLRDSPLIFEA